MRMPGLHEGLVNPKTIESAYGADLNALAQMVMSPATEAAIVSAIMSIPGVEHAEVVDDSDGCLSVSLKVSELSNMAEVEELLMDRLPFGTRHEVLPMEVQCPNEEWLGTWVEDEGTPTEAWFFVEWFEYVAKRAPSVWNWRVRIMSKTIGDEDSFLIDWRGPHENWKRPKPWKPGDSRDKILPRPKMNKREPDTGWDPGY